MNEFEIKDFRQPLVTSLGVLLGFLLGFLGQWITEEDFSLNSISDYLTLTGTVVGAGLLLYALFRMLSPVNPEAARVYYVQTLYVFMRECWCRWSAFLRRLLSDKIVDAGQGWLLGWQIASAWRISEELISFRVMVENKKSAEITLSMKKSLREPFQE